MNIYSIIFAENDRFLRGREADVVEPDDKQISTHIVPKKFKDDVEALSTYIGEERFKKGLNIEVTLSELLDVISRQRRRTDAYNTLRKYLREELGITLTIKSQKS